MNKEYIATLQDRILELIPENSRGSLSVAFEDSCSELSRLVASWIREIDDKCDLLILKGENVCNSAKSHDLLAVIYSRGEIFIIDPSVWQFFPENKSILIFIKNNLEESLRDIKKLYGGEWQVSEEITQISQTDQIKYQNIILKNMEENIRNFKSTKNR